jgi:hypothetical protein
VACYDPGYTLVEKLQTISTKYRRQQERGDMPVDFMRKTRELYERAYEAGSALYYQGKPSFTEILATLNKWKERL